MSKTLQQKLHVQHRHWQSDHEAWRLDIEAWRKELREASVALADVEEMFRDLRDALDSHAANAWEEQQKLRGHELALHQEATAGARKKTDRRWAAIHKRQAAAHDRLAAAHARIKKHHHAVVASVRRLLDRVRRAM